MAPLRIVFLLTLCSTALIAQKKADVTTICYLRLAPQSTPEDSAAISWLQSRPEYHVSILSPGSRPPSAENILWIHLPDTAAYACFRKACIKLPWLRTFAKGNGRLLLTDYAALLPWEWGIESRRPSVNIDTVPEDGLFDKKGFQSYRGHPLFNGLHGGEYIMNPRQTTMYHQIGFFGNEYPAAGDVIAVDKSYITIHKEKKLIIDYRNGRGRIIAVGSSIFFGIRNDLQRNLDRFMVNAFSCLSSKDSSPRGSSWTAKDDNPVRFDPLPSRPVPVRTPSPFAQTMALVLRDSGKSERFFDVAGRRIVAMGNERDGIDEIWAHPFRIVHDYHAGIAVSDSLIRLSQFPVRIEVRPESFTRIYTIPGGTLKEIIAASCDKPGVIVRYEAVSKQNIRLVLSMRPDMRWMWPYDADAFGGIRFGYDSAGFALHVKDSTGSFYALFGADRRPDGSRTFIVPRQMKSRRRSVLPSGTEREIEHIAEFTLDGDRKTLTFVLAGTNEGYGDAIGTFSMLRNDPEKEYSLTARLHETILNTRTIVHSPDSEFNQLYQWLLIGSSKFIAETPGVGTGLLAGYATTARGWDGAQRNSGRPGYAWYFGRDAAWAGLAFDAVGDCETVRRQLELFRQWQDSNGKIFHELTTSGVVHYDASDATPLYIVLAADYLRTSGDTAFLREQWQSLTSAMDYLYTTDTDHDGLIENVNEGHGWMESGELYIMQTETYLAGVWAQALTGMSEIARVVRYPALSERYRVDALRVRKILNQEFWIDSLNFCSFGKWPNGTYSTERGIAPAIPALFGFFDRPKGLALADAYASSLFSTDWGVHLISRDSKLFSPEGYNYGSVYPLFTGWAALTEYKYGRAAEAFTHVYANLLTKSFWTLGYSPEVIHGLRYLPTGVCPHQCWSETNTMLPVIRGMVGWDPDAAAQKASLIPQFPAQWDSARIEHLRVGSTLIDFAMIRSAGQTTYQFQSSGPEILLHFAPQLPAGAIVDSVLLDGRPASGIFDQRSGSHMSAFTLPLSGTVNFAIKHHGGIEIFSPIASPLPGDSSRSCRIISTTLAGKDFYIRSEGPSGSRGRYTLHVFDSEIDHADGADIVGGGMNGIVHIEVDFPAGREPYAAKEVIIHLR